jgi:AraC family transcriptional regulator
LALLDRIIWQIETNLAQEDISLEILADACSVSRFHMCRAFRQAAGMSIMAYVRGRRLSVAAQAIGSGDDTLLSIALKAGYGSHEAFTRAFSSCFGVLPSTVRKARSIGNLSLLEPVNMKRDMIVDVAKPDIRRRAAFRVVGLSTKATFEDTSSIPALWSEFNAREDAVQNAVHGAAYGVCCDATEAGQFRYIAGIEAKGLTQEMDHVDIPAGRYAVFTHRGHISDLPKSVYTIWNQSLPDLNLTPQQRPDFELYDDRFDPENGRGAVEIWIPISD